MALKETEIFEVSIPLPQSIDTRIFIRLVVQAKTITIHLTTASLDEPAGARPMGSFVYGLPNRLEPSQPLSTTLFSHEPTLEFSTRLAKIVARKASIPVYVTSSLSFENAGMGGTVEEEMEAFKSIVEVIMDKFKRGQTIQP